MFCVIVSRTRKKCVQRNCEDKDRSSKCKMDCCWNESRVGTSELSRLNASKKEIRRERDRQADKQKKKKRCTQKD